MRVMKNLATGTVTEQDNSGEPVPVPMAVSMAQAKKALLAAGLLDAVDTAIAAIEAPDERQRAAIDWEYAAEVRRDSALVASLAPVLGLSGEQIDALFVAAAAL